jgi:hypothetical protein
VDCDKCTRPRRAQFYTVQLGDTPPLKKIALFSCAMVSAHAAKVAKVHADIPLEDAGILKQVLSYAGAGEWIFYAPISKLWLECYRAVPTHEVQKDDTVIQRHGLHVVPDMTMRRAVYASAARVKLAHELGLRFDTDGTDLQFYIGKIASIAVLTEAHRLAMPISTYTLNGAAFAGELSIVIWLYTEHNCAFNSKTGGYSAMSGQVGVLQWLKQQGVVFHQATMLSAAVFGKESSCAYLHAEGCPWDDLIVYVAAFNKHWNIVRWLHEHGCPWNFDEICYKAAQHGNIENMAYVLQQEVVSQHTLSTMLNAAGANDHLAAAQWLRQQHNAEWPPVLYCNDKPWSGAVLEWARAEGCDSPLDQPLEDDIDEL